MKGIMMRLMKNILLLASVPAVAWGTEVPITSYEGCIDYTTEEREYLLYYSAHSQQNNHFDDRTNQQKKNQDRWFYCDGET